MEKLKEWCELLKEGKNIKGFNDIPLYSRYGILRAYSELKKNSRVEFLDGTVKAVLDKAGIETHVKGVGWEATISRPTETIYQSELVGQIMDQVEDFLEKREGSTEPILIGSNYDKLSRSVTETLQNWGVLPKGGEPK